MSTSQSLTLLFDAGLAVDNGLIRVSYFWLERLPTPGNNSDEPKRAKLPLTLQVVILSIVDVMILIRAAVRLFSVIAEVICRKRTLLASFIETLRYYSVWFVIPPTVQRAAARWSDATGVHFIEVHFSPCCAVLYHLQTQYYSRVVSPQISARNILADKYLVISSIMESRTSLAFVL